MTQFNKNALESAEYAIHKQLESLSLESNQGDIELTEAEHTKLVNFMEKLLKKRVKDIQLGKISFED